MVRKIFWWLRRICIVVLLLAAIFTTAQFVFSVFSTSQSLHAAPLARNAYHSSSGVVCWTEGKEALILSKFGECIYRRSMWKSCDLADYLSLTKEIGRKAATHRVDESSPSQAELSADFFQLPSGGVVETIFVPSSATEIESSLPNARVFKNAIPESTDATCGLVSWRLWGVAIW